MKRPGVVGLNSGNWVAEWSEETWRSGVTVEIDRYSGDLV